jgi:hypothetical protein
MLLGSFQKRYDIATETALVVLASQSFQDVLQCLGLATPTERDRFDLGRLGLAAVSLYYGVFLCSIGRCESFSHKYSPSTNAAQQHHVVSVSLRASSSAFATELTHQTRRL